MALIQLELGVTTWFRCWKATELYDAKVKLTKELMENKKSWLWWSMARDACEFAYGSDFAKITSCKTNRRQQRKNNCIRRYDDTIKDMINYSIFALILMGFGK
jgi:hypothetical protein